MDRFCLPHALALLVVSALLTAFAHGSSHGVAKDDLRICYQMPGDGRGGGLTQVLLEGARNAAQRIRAEFPNAKLWSNMYLNQSPSVVKNQTKHMIDMIERDGCNAIVSTGFRMWDRLRGGLIDDMSALYPNVSFFLYTGSLVRKQFTGTQPANVFTTGSTYNAAVFAMGAAAGYTCTSCVSLFLSGRNSPGLGFLEILLHRGMQFGAQFRSDGANVSALCPFIVGRTALFTDAPAEAAFTRVMQQRGCSIVASFTDSFESARLIQREALKTPNGNSMFSMTVGLDGSLFIGDNVLASSSETFDDVFYRFMHSYYMQTPFVSGIFLDVVAQPSPRVHKNVSLVLAAAEGTYKNTTGGVVWCTALYNSSGLINAVVNGTMQCVPALVYTNLVTTFDDPAILLNPWFVSPLQCAAGTFATYSVFGDLSLACVPCPAGTIAAAAGQMACVPCPAATQPSANRTECLPPIADAHVDERLTVVLLAVLVPCVGAALLVLAWVALRPRERAGIRSVPPPSGPLMAVGILFVDPARSSKNWQEEILVGAYVFEVLRQSVQSAAAQHGAFCVPSPALFILAADTAEQLVEVAEDVERTLVTHSDAYSTCFLSISAIVTYGAATSEVSGAEHPANIHQITGEAFTDAIGIRRQMNGQPGLSGLCLQLRVFSELKGKDPSLAQRFQKSVCMVQQSGSRALTDEDVVVSLRFRFIPAPGQRSAETIAHRRASQVVKMNQKQTLRAMFDCIASRFLFTASADVQERTARILASRFNVYLSAPAKPGTSAPAPATAPASGRVPPRRSQQLHAMLHYAAPLVLDDMDEMGVRECITEMLLLEEQAQQGAASPQRRE